jgi:23S rRNA (uridine2552-2'-O)-methyltransferase
MPRQRKLHDRFFKQAKTEGYAARSAYKLKEIQERFHLIRRSDRVLDLGCAPGSWLQVASELVGPEGRVVGIDLQRVRVPAMPNVNVLEGDIYQTDALVLRKWAYPDLNMEPPMFDVVISDMAPNTTGHGDHFLSVRLCRRAMELFPHLLREGGGTTMKVFEGEEFPDLLNECRAVFGSVKPFKPKACRDVSRETYIVAKGYRWTDRAPKGQQASPHAKPASRAESQKQPNPITIPAAPERSSALAKATDITPKVRSSQPPNNTANNTAGTTANTSSEAISTAQPIEPPDTKRAATPKPKPKPNPKPKAAAKPTPKAKPKPKSGTKSRTKSPAKPSAASRAPKGKKRTRA